MQIRTRFAVLTIAAVLAAYASPVAGSVESGSRRAVLDNLASRFTNEIYPLFARDSNGCAVCHHSESTQVFRVLDSPGATFSLVLEHDLLAPDDPVAIPGRLSTENEELRMPQAGQLEDKELETILAFARDLAESLDAMHPAGSSPSDERFPDALLLPYDGPDRDQPVMRRMSYYQLRRSFETLFGPEWLADSGSDPFDHKANRFGGADFRASFETSRTVSASYLASLQEVAREVARRYVSAPREVLFDGFDPGVRAARDRKFAARNVRTLYERILFSAPGAAETERALTLVRRLQRQPVSERTVRLSLDVEDSQGRQDRQHIDVLVRAARASVAQFRLDQSRTPTDGASWVRVGDAPFSFEKGNPDHFVRVVARPGNHVTAFDAVKLAPVMQGVEADEGIVLDNLDPECILTGEWEPIEKEGERSRAGPPKKKYQQDLRVVGSNHLESRTLENRLSYATMALRIPESGDFNVYLSWPAIPKAATAAVVEVRSANRQGRVLQPSEQPVQSTGIARIRFDQTESTLDETGETQWERVHREVLLENESDYVEISNAGVDSTKHVIVADAVKFVPLDGGEAIIVDNSSVAGFEKSEGWAPDELTRNSPGRGKMYGNDVLHYPPSKNGNPIKDVEIDADNQVWARYRPVRDDAYQPGWYSVYLWTPGGHTHSDWVAIDIRGSAFAPVAKIEAAPELVAGESAILNGTGTFHPEGAPLSYRWSHDAEDLDLRMDGADSPTPRITVPTLASPRPGWAGLIEALLQRPEFVFPSDAAQAPSKVMLARVALDLVGRIPTQQEFQLFDKSGSLESMIDRYLDSEDFQSFFFHRARTVLRSRGTQESDEPARLWTHIATNDLSYRELFTADYTISADWERTSRRPEHGKTGILTMKGYLVGKPGLPKFTYPAQVLTFAMGLQFEVSDAVEQAREKVVSTTDPASMCYSCHKLLTPLAFQRERWDVHGHYRTVDEDHNPIDDSDRGVVADYPFPGLGLSAFATQVVRKERFVRTFVNLHHDMLFHRQLRVYEDQRDDYRKLYEFALENDLQIRPLLKQMLLMRYGRT